MPSPFPGMNPYLEQEEVWQDFHDRLVPAIGDALSPQVSPHFIVKIQEHLYIHKPKVRRRIRVGSGDVDIARAAGRSRRSRGTAILDAPVQVLLPEVLVESQTYLEIRDRQSRALITVIKLLSPTNKRAGADREQYLSKRANVLRSAAHFVEIDLLRGWERMPSENAPESEYCIMVSQVEHRPRAAYWPVKLREPLPQVPIPLQNPTPLVHLDLQEELHKVYDRAYYKDYIYDGEPTPALTPAEKAWALARVGRRRHRA
jgi:Protein of unknown function (DUF4058)